VSWPPRAGGKLLTHVLAANFGATFLQAVLDVLALVALVVPQTPDEVVEGLFEPAAALLALASAMERQA
jgi:hypothetical protein